VSVAMPRFRVRVLLVAPTFVLASVAGTPMSTADAVAAPAAAPAAQCTLPVATGTSPLVDGANAAGLGFVDRSWSGNPDDFNGDGAEDVLLGFHQHTPAHLMRQNSDCTFTWVDQNTWPKRNQTGFIFDRHKCTWADFDRNGLDDSYCNGGRDQENAYKVHGRENELNLQTSPGVFTFATNDNSSNFDVGGECVRGRYTTSIDVNGDGWPDLFMGSEAPRNVKDPKCTAQYAKNSKVFINQGDNAQGVWQGLVFDPGWNVMQANAGQNCAVPWDYDHDGRMDLLACNLVTKAPYLFHNTGNGFVNTAGALGLTPMSDAVVGDINNDGVADLVFSDVDGFAYRLGTATGLRPAVRLGAVAKNADGSGVAIADLDGDGQPDIYGLADTAGTTGNPDDVVFMNKGLAFTTLAVPSAAGRGDYVVPMTLANGQQAFLVGNGRLANDGPIQLIEYNPRPATG
jgi:hypothetical protein